MYSQEDKVINEVSDNIDFENITEVAYPKGKGGSKTQNLNTFKGKGGPIVEIKKPFKGKGGVESSSYIDALKGKGNGETTMKISKGKVTSDFVMSKGKGGIRRIRNTERLDPISLTGKSKTTKGKGGIRRKRNTIKLEPEFTKLNLLFESKMDSNFLQQSKKINYKFDTFSISLLQKQINKIFNY